MAKKGFRIPTPDDIRALLQSDEYKRAVEERMALMKREDSVVEEAPWFGTTGLDDETERELPRYLRREFGESLFEEGSLRAAQLKYVGRFEEAGATVHYWNVPYGERSDVYAYVEVEPDGATCTGWGGREPPSE